MANTLRAFAILQLSMQLDALLLRKALLLELKLRGQVEQAHLALLLGKHLVEKCQMIAKEEDGGGIVHRRIAAD